MPKLSDTMVEGTIARWIKKVGDEVEVGDIIAEVETDKATMEMEAFDDGVLKEIYVQDGGTAKVGEKIALLVGDDDEAANAEPQKTDLTTKKGASEEKAVTKSAAADKSAAPMSESVGSSQRVKASPLARKIAKERGVSLEGIAGTGPGGRIVAADVPEASDRSATPVPASAPKIPVVPPSKDDTRIPLSAMRRVIGERLLASKTQIPHFYLSLEMDASALVRVRRELNSANEANGGPKLTVNDFILLAVSRAAVAYPAVNAAWAGDGIIQYAGVHISVAVAVEDGLVTPVIRDSQRLGLREISAAVKDLATRARAKKLKPEELQGGTITVSNLGGFGIEQFYAIVNPPQAVILAIGAIVKKPVVAEDGSIVARERMTISLSGDHRVVDGAVGAEFIVGLRRLIENPALMLF